MVIRRIEAGNFRSYDELVFEPVAGLNLVVGKNASGKTNLLEAIYLCAYGKGFRGADADLLKRGRERAHVEANFRVGGGVDRTVRVELRRRTKEIAVGNKRLAKRQDLVGQFPVVLSGAWDFDIAAGDPKARRKYLDGLLGLLSPAYLATLRDYLRALKQRNLLLTEMREADPARLREKIEPWTESLIGYGSLLCARREAIVGELRERVRRYYTTIAGADEGVDLEYVPNVRAVEGSYADGLRRRFGELFEKERRRGLTLAGPHLDELLIQVGGVELRRFGSRGEQKTAVLALRLAQVEMIAEKRGERPVLLLDDVFSDLDIRRAERVLRAVGDLQVVATSAEEERVREVKGGVEGIVGLFRVEKGAGVQEISL
ncbi:MAG: DNA replication and repair protein RecF [Calditrichaeota bacterium]|nr:DNA replication and repair protein RecF [Calditrichota bacterium]